MEPLLRAAAADPHLHLAAFASLLLAAGALLWWGLRTRTHRVVFGRGQADRGQRCPTGPAAGAGTFGTAKGRHRALQFVLLFLGMGVALNAEALVAAAAELRLHPAVVGAVLLGVAGLFNSAIHGVHFLVARRPAEAAPIRRASGPLLHHFVMLCLAMGAALNAEWLLAQAEHLDIHSGVVACFVLAVTARFNWEILSINLRVARRPAKGQSKTVLRRAIASAEAAPAPRLHRHHVVVLCLAMGVALNAEPLFAAAVDLGIPSGIVACSLLAVTALFNWEILSVNLRIARPGGEREDKMLPRPAASAAWSPHASRLAFGILAALVSASWFVEPFVAAAEHCLPRVATTGLVLCFAALFNVWIHIFHSFLLPRAPSSRGAAAQGQSIGASTAGIISVGIAVTACLVGAFGTAYYVCSPARA